MSEDLTHSRTRTFSVPRIEDDIMEEFKSLIKSEVAVPVCAMKALVTVIKRSTGTTWMQLEHELRSAILALKECKVEDLGGRTNISLGSGCELFMKYVTRSFLEYTVKLPCIYLIEHRYFCCTWLVGSYRILMQPGKSLFFVGRSLLVCR